MRPSFRNVKKKRRRGATYYIALILFIASVSSFVVYGAAYARDAYKNQKELEELRAARERFKEAERLAILTKTPTPTPTDTPTPTLSPTPAPTLPPLPNGDPAPTYTPVPTPTPSPSPSPTPVPPKMLPLAEHYYSINHDYIGWLTIPDTNVDNPVVMEKSYDTEYYLTHSFEGAESRNGTLFTQNRCEVGIGTKADGYKGGKSPTTNILIFGHNMGNLQMFWNLKLFLKQDYYEQHKFIEFDTAYEHRVYEICAIFRSHEFEDPFDDNFKYYFFYNAETQEEFDYWYDNIKKASEVKCSATASYGDEFITLSTCHSTDETGKQNKEGRLAIVGVRVK